MDDQAKKDLYDNLSTLTVDDLRLDDLYQSLLAYEQGMIKIVHPDPLRHTASSILDVVENEDRVIKIEQYEKFSQRLFDVCRDLGRAFDHRGPVTCHVFISPAGGQSFPEHTDPDDVFLFMLKGKKHVRVNAVEVTLCAGDDLFIRHDTPHEVFTEEASVMLSFGLERFIVEKL